LELLHSNKINESLNGQIFTVLNNCAFFPCWCAQLPVVLGGLASQETLEWCHWWQPQHLQCPKACGVALGMQRGHLVKPTWGLELASTWTWIGHLGLSDPVTVLFVFHACYTCKVKYKPRNIFAEIHLEHGKVQGTQTEDKVYSFGVSLMNVTKKKRKRHNCWEIQVLVYS